MRLGISLEPPLWPSGSGGMVLQSALRAEQLGFDYVLMSGHVLHSESGSALDPLILLSALAGATSRIRLATSVLVLPYHHPVALAGQAASLDVLAGGRFTLGVGAGWSPEEFAALGVPLRERGARTDEHLAVMKALWAGGPVDFEGRFTSLRQAVLGTPPRTPDGPPLWIGGHSDAALRRALRFADGWHGGGLDPAGVAEVRTRLATLTEASEAATGFGSRHRDPADLALSSVCFLVPPGFEPVRPTPGPLLAGPGAGTAALLDALGRLKDAGLAMVSLWMPLGPHEFPDALAWAAEELLPKLRS